MLYKLFLCYIVVINLIAFFAFLIDKDKARRRKWRIPESTLMSFAIVGGSIGALMGMYVWRHKTHHVNFLLGLPLVFLCHVAIAICIVLFV